MPGKVSLVRLEDEHKDYFALLVANHHSVSKARKELHKTFPDIHQYGETSFRKYLKTHDAKERIEKAKEKIREEAKEHLLSDRPGRVASLTELAGRILGKLREVPEQEVGSTLFTTLSKEYRATLAEIRTEMEIFGEGSAGLDLFETFRNLYEMQQQVPAFLKEAFSEDNSKGVLIAPVTDD